MEGYPRTKDEAILDVRYHIKLHFIHQRLYRRIRAWISGITIFAGSGVVVSGLQKFPYALTVLGATVIALSISELLAGWADRAAKHTQWHRAMGKLLEGSGGMSLEGIDAALAAHEAEVDDEIESLRVPTYNDVMRSNGRLTMIKRLSRMERFIWLLA